jgi:sortase (surface protein transpeptidase)
MNSYPYAWDYPATIPSFPSITLPEEPIITITQAESHRARWYKRLAIALTIVGFMGLAISYGPSALFWAQAKFGGNENEAQNLSIKSIHGQEVLSMRKTPSNYLPTLDRSLPKGNWIIIPSIGVKTEINEAPDEDYEEALKKGVWRAPEFGTPEQREYPLIVAAHRFGYLAWTNSYRHYNSFYNLPNAKEGDTVEVIWNQRKYVYAIYGSSEGEYVADYSADLVLYTCEDLTSSIRIFRYAKLLEI